MCAWVFRGLSEMENEGVNMHFVDGVREMCVLFCP